MHQIIVLIAGIEGVLFTVTTDRSDRSQIRGVRAAFPGEKRDSWPIASRLTFAGPSRFGSITGQWVWLCSLFVRAFRFRCSGDTQHLRGQFDLQGIKMRGSSPRFIPKSDPSKAIRIVFIISLAKKTFISQLTGPRRNRNCKRHQDADRR